MSFRSPDRLRPLYETIAPIYAVLTAPISSRARRRALRWLSVTDGERVVEVGPGPGRAFQALLTQNPTGWSDAVEPVASLRARTRRRAARAPHRRYRIRDGTATALPYPPNHVDALFSAYVYDLLPHEHLPVALAEIRRVLHPAGRAVFVTMDSGSSIADHMWGAVARWAPPVLGGSRPLPLPPALRSAGLSISRSTTISQAGFPSRITAVRPCASN